HLAADGQQARRPPAVEPQPERHRGDRPRVRRHVLAARAIAARDRAGEYAVLVDQLERGAIELRLEDEPGRAGIAAYAGDEARDVVPLPRRVQADHRRQVLDGPEPGRRLSGHALRGRVRRDEVGEALLDALQRIEEAVV